MRKALRWLLALTVLIGTVSTASAATAAEPEATGSTDIKERLLSIPGMTVTAPKDGTELLALIRSGVEHGDGPFSVRYPRDSAPDTPRDAREIEAVPFGTWEVLRSVAQTTGNGDSVAILAV